MGGGGVAALCAHAQKDKKWRPCFPNLLKINLSGGGSAKCVLESARGGVKKGRKTACVLNVWPQMETIYLTTSHLRCASRMPHFKRRIKQYTSLQGQTHPLQRQTLDINALVKLIEWVVVCKSTWKPLDMPPTQSCLTFLIEYKEITHSNSK